MSFKLCAMPLCWDYFHQSSDLLHRPIVITRSQWIEEREGEGDKEWKMEEEKERPKKDRKVRPRHLTKHKSAIIQIHSRLAQPECHSSFVQCPCAGITFTRAQIFFIAHCDYQVSVDRRERRGG